MKFASALLLAFAFGSIAIFAQSGCGTSTGNPLVSVEFKSYTTASSGGFGIPFIAPAYAALTEIRLCFKRVRFKQDGNSSSPNKDEDPDNRDFPIGEVILQNSGTRLGTVNLPPGIYKRVEFDLHDQCSSGKSVQVINSNGIYSTTDSIEIKFAGTFRVSSDRSVQLNIQPILAQLDLVNSSSQIKSRIEGIEGDFED